MGDGLRFAEVMDVPQPRRSFSEDLRARVFSRLVRFRLRIAPAIVVVGLFFIALDPTPFRVALFLVPALALLALSGYEHRLAARGELSEGRELVSLILTSVMQLVVIFASGGIASPVLPAVLIITVVVSVTLEPRSSMLFVFGVQVPAIWMFAVVHHLGLLPGLVPPAYAGLVAAPGSGGSGPFLAAAFVSVAAFGGSAMGRYLRSTIVDMAEERIEDRTRVLAVHAETARTIASLSGEIAHELKNPLASIKGLAALVRKDIDGRTAERMDVLRSEVDRMQTILDDFLAHARPIVPLAIEKVEIGELARHVVAMHEGTALERRVRLSVRGSAPLVECDPRKIRQILINLVQNALEASAEDDGVELEVTAEGNGCAIRVRDHGPGIDPAVRDRLFEVGATTKARGTGLGLVVARGLARQHGGELSLRDAEGGGCEAVLELPTAPTVAPNARAERTTGEKTVAA